MDRCFNFEPTETPNFEGFKKEDLRIKGDEVHLKDKHIGRILKVTKDKGLFKDEDYTVFMCTDRTGEFRGVILIVDERRKLVRARSRVINLGN